ncbi:hypothetical protein VTJ49DRAFT_7645 [Mycothermus thermophilus]|uniref:F-box domain-containing protein n=1 Tax=Humicola insolens TaxID=85995 RepID=A0ABR3VHU1_HUMIN
MSIPNNDILLLIAEHLDAKSLRNLMRTSKDSYRLIKANEKSIAGDPSLISPRGAVLSSTLYDSPARGAYRTVLQTSSFQGIAELDSRRRRIEAFFDQPAPNSPHGSGCLRIALSEVIFSHRLSPQQIARLVEGLKDACWVSERLTDCEAEVVNTLSRSDTSTIPREKVHTTRRNVLLKELSPIRLALLALLGELIATVPRGLSFSLERARRPENVAKNIELLLRCGTVALYASACDASLGRLEMTGAGDEQALAVHRRMKMYYDIQAHTMSSILYMEEDQNGGVRMQETLFRTLWRALGGSDEVGKGRRVWTKNVCAKLAELRRSVILKWLEE